MQFAALDGAVTRYIEDCLKVLRDQQDETLDRLKAEELRDLEHREATAAERKARPLELARHRLFTLCDPETILGPPNIVHIYLHGAPMWSSSAWEPTAAVNAQMLSFLQQLADVGDDPVSDDIRLALPMTIASFTLREARAVDPEGQRRAYVDVAVKVYKEIAKGIGILERQVLDARLGAAVGAEFLAEFA